MYEWLIPFQSYKNNVAYYQAKTEHVHLNFTLLQYAIQDCIDLRKLLSAITVYMWYI
jgi:hypothetical protein